MGSQLSQSQQLRNTFPLSQYKLLPTDKNFPQLIFLQKLSDSSIFAVKATDKNKEAYVPCSSKHVIKRVQKKQINKKLYEMYEWANANVQGLVQYIHLVDKNRKISKSQFNAIVQGAVRGYSAVSKQCFQIECLQISMKKLRIFNQISLKNGSFNSKQVFNCINVKLIPKSLNQCLQKDQIKTEIWSHVGSCIHQGGILTQKQLLGEYLLQLSNYATKKNFKNKTESLKNLKLSFGVKSYRTIESLLSNQDWKSVIKIIETSFEEQKLSPLKQIQNKPKVTETIHMNNEKGHDTQKTIDTEKNTSQKVLFQCFRNQQKNQNNPPPTRVQSPPKQTRFQTYLNIAYSPMDRSRINSNQHYRSVSPVKTDNFLSPTSVKIVREVSPPVLTKIYQRPDDFTNIENLKLTRTNSVLTIFPQIHRDQQAIRNRMLSTKNIPNIMFSPETKKTQNQYANSPIINSPRYENKNEVSQTNIDQREKRKGKKLQLRLSKSNPPLKQIVVPSYQWKIKVDKVEGSKKPDQNHNDQRNKNDSFLSQQFNSLHFELSDKYFFPRQSNSSKPNLLNDQQQKQNLNKSPKIQIKTNTKPSQSIQAQGKYMNSHQKSQSQKVLHYPPRQKNHFSIEVKEANSQTILFDPESNISFQKVKKGNIASVKAQDKESKYVGPMNIKGQKEGEGKLYFPSGGYYIGSFYKDFMHGNGKLYYPCGKIAYEGTFKYDKFHGSGKIHNQSPTFVSSFDFRNFNKLELTQKEQTVHKEHQLISGVQRDKKISYWKFYEGEMNHDMKHGKGVLMLENGQKYEGEFKDDLVHGKGIFYGNNGKISGRWEDNLLMEVYR